MTKGLQSAARTICTPLAYKSHTCSLIGIFCQVQEVNCPEGAREATLGCAPTENDQNPFAACGRQTLRGFFDRLESCMYFWFFKLKKRGKKTAETRRRNCAVLHYENCTTGICQTGLESKTGGTQLRLRAVCFLYI